MTCVHFCFAPAVDNKTYSPPGVRSFSLLVSLSHFNFSDDLKKKGEKKELCHYQRLVSHADLLLFHQMH